jgi:hypothetical protein
MVDCFYEKNYGQNLAKAILVQVAIQRMSMSTKNDQPDCRERFNILANTTEGLAATLILSTTNIQISTAKTIDTILSLSLYHQKSNIQRIKMTSCLFLSAALLLPVALAIPVPQTLSTTITGPGGRPVGTASLGGLDTTLTLGQGPQNNLPYNGGGNQPPCRPWLSSCWGNNGNNWPSGGNNNNPYEPYVPGPNTPWETNYSPQPLPDAPGGPAGTASVSTYGSGFVSRWAERKRDDPTSGWWDWFRGNGESIGGLTTGISGGATPPNAARPPPSTGDLGGSDIGGLSS